MQSHLLVLRGFFNIWLYYNLFDFQKWAYELFIKELECGIRGKVKRNTKAVGGDDVVGNEFPWQVQLIKLKYDDLTKTDLYHGFCGGSIGKSL